MKPLIALSIIGFITLLISFAQETPTIPDKSEKASESGSNPFSPTIDTPPLIRVQVEYIELSHKALTRLLMEDKAETADATALRMKAQELVEKDEAKVIDTQLIIGKSGDKCISESNEEIMYPSEYVRSIPDDVTKEDMEKNYALIGGLVSPTAYETKVIGSKLEVEPRLDEDSRLLELRLLSNIDWHTGNREWLETKDELGNTSQVAMPDFYGITIDTAINCISGQYVFFSVVSPKNSEGKLDTEKKVMVFVKCKVLPVVP